ncbi:MAG: phosphatase PAP2 family protein [Solirubrobacteraceae bacterium]
MAGHAYPARAGHSTWRPGRASALTPLAVAALLVVVLAAIWLLAELVPAVHLKDAVALDEVTMLGEPRLDSIGNFLLRLLNPIVFLLWAVALVAVAIARQRPRTAVAVAALLVLAPLSAHLLKPVLAHSHDQVGYVHIGAASWPSGHSTAAAALAICAVLVAPPRLRPLVAALGALFALAIGFSLLLLAWHMPSDVLGGYFAAGLWTALAVAALRAYERGHPSGAPGAGVL